MKLSNLVLLFCMLIVSCKNSKLPDTSDSSHQEVNSVYYWKTVFSIDDDNWNFIKKHNIGRIYLRMFDVAKDAENSKPENATYPNATVLFKTDGDCFLTDSLANIEIVPVVYITIDALKAMMGHESMLADKIVTRVRNMVEYNDLMNVSEMQLDCDWTTSTEESYFKLCDAVRSKIKDLNLPWELSSTIRLHQLARKAPPVNRGVLMVYNTGSFDNPDTRNSIIDLDDIKPYLKRLPDYSLHLDVAYPTYSWQLLFRKRNFIGLTNGLTLTDSTKFSRRGEQLYFAMHDIPHNGTMILAGDMIRSEMSDYSDIKAVKHDIDLLLSGRPHSNIIYHLDCENLSNYKSDEIQNILSSNN